MNIAHVDGPTHWRRLALLAVVTLVAAVTVVFAPHVSRAGAATSQAWVEQRSAEVAPADRGGSALVYDAARQRTVLFGGQGNNVNLGDTWEWDGTTWTQQHPITAPPARTNAAMAYDAARQRVVLFGGTNNNVDLGDTWEWDGTSWTQQHPATAPSAYTGSPRIPQPHRAGRSSRSSTRAPTTATRPVRYNTA
jgi:hypothetical protein